MQCFINLQIDNFIFHRLFCLSFIQLSMGNSFEKLNMIYAYANKTKIYLSTHPYADDDYIYTLTLSITLAHL